MSPNIQGRNFPNGRIGSFGKVKPTFAQSNSTNIIQGRVNTLVTRRPQIAHVLHQFNRPEHLYLLQKSIGKKKLGVSPASDNCGCYEQDGCSYCTCDEYAGCFYNSPSQLWICCGF
jgi:hypothetical protein